MKRLLPAMVLAGSVLAANAAHARAGFGQETGSVTDAATLALVGLGLAGLGFWRRNKKS